MIGQILGTSSLSGKSSKVCLALYMYVCDMVILKVCLRRKVISNIDSKDDYCFGFVYCFIPLPVWKDADTSVHHLVTALLSVLQNSC